MRLKFDAAAIIVSMGKYFDGVGAVFAAFTTIFLICALAEFPLWLSLAVAASSSLVLTFATRAIIKRSRGIDGIIYNDFVTYCVVSGEERVRALLQIACEECEMRDGALYIRGVKTIVRAKLSALSPDNLIDIYRAALVDGTNEIKIILPYKDKKISAFSKKLPHVEFIFSDFKPLYASLKKKSALPQSKLVKVPKRELIKSAFENVLSVKNCKRFLFVALVLVLLSYLTPLKIYYLTVSAVSLFIAVLCLFWGKKNDRTV